jgi:3-hydroxyacyl-[acyl-carrier-protein] dehydratase
VSSHRFEVDIAADHPAFDGHFPGHPVLPGVVLLAEVLAGIERWLGQPLDGIRIKVAKFHAPVAPGSLLTVELIASGVAGAAPASAGLALADLARPGGIAFTVSCGDTRVATGTVTK